jgi:hypothetical protein
MRFSKMSPSERERAESLLADYVARPEHRDATPGTRAFYHLVGAAARGARHGDPPTRWQRLGYRTAKRNRARAAAAARYGDPSASVPIPRPPTDR